VTAAEVLVMRYREAEAPETGRARGQANAGGARGLEYSLGIMGWGQNSKHLKNTI